MDRSWFAVVVFLLSATLTSGQRLLSGDACLTSSGVPGVCKTLDSCTSAQDELSRGKIPTVCSYDKITPMVCCLSSAASNSKPTTKLTSKPATAPASIVKRETGGVGRKSREKCRQYSAAVWHEESEPTLTLIEDEPPPRINVSVCGVQDSAELIVGGEPAAPKEFPHMATIGFGDERNIKWLCGGSLISERFVLTAAHCVFSSNRGLAKWVRLGDLNLARTDDDAQPQQFSVVQRIRHPNYSALSHYDDIGLLKLNTGVKMDAYVRPACLNVDRHVAVDVFLASGWGRTKWDEETVSDELMKVKLSPVTQDDCYRSYKSLEGTNKLKFGIKEDKMVCAGEKEGGKDTCPGDSGGPLQIVLKEPYCMYSIVGVTSFGSLVCGAENSPAVYTRVSNYVAWIESVVWP